MIKKYKILLILTVLIIFTFSAGIAYSFFNSSTTFVSNNQKIAKFVFDAKIKDNVELPIVDLNPDESKDYSFQIKNTIDGKKSDVSINYQITIKTYHFLPTIINLYQNDKLLMTCDESYSRNSENELICNSEIMKLDHKDKELKDYKIEVKYEDGYNELIYKDLVDYIDLEIRSWQIVE